MKRLSLMVLAVASAFTAGCRDNESRELQYLGDMYRNPALRPQEAYPFFKFGSFAVATPPDNTLPIGFTRYPYAIAEGERAGDELTNPLPLTREVLLTGQKYYNIHCIVCHGQVGAGDGLATVSKREIGMPIPPSLYTDKIREWKDGLLYHTITVGQGNMPGYGHRLDPAHRWAIVHYVRALGNAANPSETDIAAVERLGWNAESRDRTLLTDPEEIMEKRSIFRLEFTEKDEAGNTPGTEPEN